MRREEKRRKLHEAVLKTLYPPPPQDEDQDEKPVNSLDEDFDVGLVNPDDYLRSITSSSEEEDGELGPQKRTRAQRKRLRKKKLKEDAERRRKLIGPLLPTTSDIDNYGRSAGVETDSPDVRQNANEESGVTCDNPRELSVGCSNQDKLKHRRAAKRVGREQLKVASAENNSQDQKHSEL